MPADNAAYLRGSAETKIAADAVSAGDSSAAMSRACPKCGTPGGAEITHVCMTAGRIDGPVAGNHLCQQPLVFGLTSPQQPDWTCGVCGRMWRDQISGAVRWWAEIRGPNV